MALVSYHLCGLLAWVYRVTWGCLYSARKPKRLGGHFTLSFPQPPLKTGRSVYVGVVEECCFDRFEISHKVSLLDMHAKYGTVMSLHEGAEYLQTKAQPTPASRRAPEPVR